MNSKKRDRFYLNLFAITSYATLNLGNKTQPKKNQKFKNM